MEAVYEGIRNIAVYLILVTVFLNLVNGNSYKKYVELVCGMVLILIIISPITSLLALDDNFQYNFDLSSFKVEMMEQEFLAKAEEVNQEKMEEEYKTVLMRKINEIVEKEGRNVKKADITLSKEDYGIIEEIIVEIVEEEAKNEDTSVLVEEIWIDEVVISVEETDTGEDMENSEKENAIAKEKNKTTERIRQELASAFAMKEEQIIVYEKEE